MMDDSDLATAVGRWAHDPVAFVEEACGARPEPWQREALAALVESDHIAVRSGRGVGKSAFLSWVILWWLTTRYPAKALCTAPKADQLSDVLWSELARWMRNMPKELSGLFELQSDALRLRGAEKEVFAVARTAKKENSEAFQGMHSANQLIVADESSGIDEVIFEVSEGSLSTAGSKMVLTGNPTRVQGYFYDAFHKMRAFWRIFHVPCSASSQTDPGWIERSKKKHGEHSNWFRVHVMGDFPTGEDDQVIPLYLVEGAVGRDVVGYVDAAIVWGLDVARYGDDASALCKRRGNVILEPARAWRGKDTMQTVGMVMDEYHRAKEKPAFICVDVIGLGAGVADRLREQGLPVRGISVSEQPSVEDRYSRLRDELWWRAREWFEKLDCTMPDDEELIGELTGPSYTFLSSGKIKVESKDAMKKRLGAEGSSPDKADAFCLTFAMGPVTRGAYKRKLVYDDRPFV